MNNGTISRRDLFAVQIFAALMSNPDDCNNFAEKRDIAIEQADELIKQLDKRDRVKSSDDYWAFDREAKEDA